jgi:hypothetical protein
MANNKKQSGPNTLIEPSEPPTMGSLNAAQPDGHPEQAA